MKTIEVRPMDDQFSKMLARDRGTGRAVAVDVSGPSPADDHAENEETPLGPSWRAVLYVSAALLAMGWIAWLFGMIKAVWL